MHKDTHQNKIALFAADHRGSFEALFPDIPGSQKTQALNAYKLMLAEACLSVVDTAARPVFLSDMMYGESALRLVRSQAIPIAAPLERSGGEVFELDTDEHIQAIIQLAPEYIKCLVRVHIHRAQDELHGVVTKLVQAAHYARDIGADLIVEIVPYVAVDGISHHETQAHDVTLVMDYLWRAGVRPGYWKIPGSSQASYYETIGRYIAQGHDRARILILGADAPLATVQVWLRVAAHYPFVAGFAVGRTLWKDSIKKYHTGELSRAQAIYDIAERYRTCCIAIAGL